MMLPSTSGPRFLVICLALRLFVSSAEAACDPSETVVAEIFDFKGDVQVREANTAPQTVLGPTPVCLGDVVAVGNQSRARLFFAASEETLVIDQNTEFIVHESDDEHSLVEILRGALLFFTRGSRALEIQTAFVNATVEGTEFVVRVEADRARITVLEGRLRAFNGEGEDLVGSNQFAEVLEGQAPRAQDIPIDIRPRDAVRWALYYQPILPDDSLAQLELVPEADRDAEFYARRASQLLAVGRLEEAQDDIDDSIGLDENHAEAYALRAVIAIALNDTTSALGSGRQAVESNPQSADARIALSYALQSNFELDAARDTLLEAVEQEPDNGRAWARLAELWLSLGYLDRAFEAADTAASLAPELARTQSVRGFAALARVDTSGARAAFERATELESDSPLARLGLGWRGLQKVTSRKDAVRSRSPLP